MKVVHEGAKVPATCSLCQLTFENHSKMVKHKRKEHWDAGKDRKVQCEECGKCCVNSSALKVIILYLIIQFITKGACSYDVCTGRREGVPQKQIQYGSLGREVA